MAEPIGEFLLLRRLREANQSYRDELALLTGRHALLLSAARRAVQPNADLDDLRLAALGALHLGVGFPVHAGEAPELDQPPKHRLRRAQRRPARRGVGRL